uniref:Transcription initiation factor TFIID subunit 9 n=1 Tax=Sexangularia sp. CB-2014 TaxID=1486929 RepID=A0A7S1VHH7_9EUKA
MSDEDFIMSTDVPRDAKIMSLLISSMGISEYDPRIIVQLLEFEYRLATELLSDAIQYADHSGRALVRSSDVKLAIAGRASQSYGVLPPRQVLLAAAADRNAVPLPLLPTRAGVISLPPLEFQAHPAPFALLD